MKTDIKVSMKACFKTGMKTCFNDGFNNIKVKYRADY